MTKGRPKRVTMLSMMKFRTCHEVVFLREIASIHLVKYSVAVMIKLCPVEDVGMMGPMMSSPHH